VDGPGPLDAAHEWKPLSAQVWNLADGTMNNKPWDDWEVVWAVAYSPDGKVLATAEGSVTQEDLAAPPQHGAKSTSRGFVKLWDPAKGTFLRTTGRHRNAVVALAFSPDGKWLLTGSVDQTACFWDVATGRPLGEPLRHPGPVTAVAFSPTRYLAVTTSFAG